MNRACIYVKRLMAVSPESAFVFKLRFSFQSSVVQRSSSGSIKEEYGGALRRGRLTRPAVHIMKTLPPCRLPSAEIGIICLNGKNCIY